MATLTGNAINTSYQGLVKFNDNGAADPLVLKQLSDGVGGSLPLSMSQIETKFAEGSAVDFTNVTVNGLPAPAAGLVAGTATDSLKNSDALVTNPATSSGPQSIALGNGAVANNNQSIAIGNFSESTSIGSAAVGEYASANGIYSSAWGRTAYARADGSVAFGQQAGVPVGVNGGVAMGRQVVADLADTTHVRALKIVAPDGGTGGNGITLLSPNGTPGLVTLTDASELAVDGTPIGGGGAAGLAAGTGTDSIASTLTTIPATATAADSIGIGKNADATGLQSIAFGLNALASGRSSIAIGENTDATQADSIAIGENAQSTDLYTIALGVGAGATNDWAIAIGKDAKAYSRYCMAIGQSAVAGVQFGNLPNYALALGWSADAIANQTVALGYNAQATADGAYALGAGVTAATANTSTVNLLQIAGYATMNFADDAAAATGGIPLGGVYHTDGALKIRIV